MKRKITLIFTTVILLCSAIFAFTACGKFDNYYKMSKFIYTETATTCEITGVKDKTVKEITVPDFVTSIALGAFEGCNSLESLTIPFVGNTKDGEENTHFGYIFGADSCYDNFEFVPNKLSNITVTGGKSIDSDAFSDCESLQSINIPTGVSSIGDRAFYNCKSLQSINIPTGVTSIGYKAFYNCKSLQSIIIPSGITSIDNSMFAGCESLESITIPKSITEISTSYFSGCPNLTRLELPSTIKAVYGTISDSVEVVIAEGAELELKTGCFINTKTMTVTGSQDYAVIPDGVKVIGEGAFQGTKLKTINIPASVESIGDYAFLGVEVEESFELTLGANLKYVGYSAFASAMTIDKVTISTNLPLSEGLFGSYKSNGAKIKNLICDVQPNVVENITDEKPTRSCFVLSALNNEAPYIYLKDGVNIINTDGKFSALAYKKLSESDLAGYDKYTTAETANKNGYYMLRFQTSTSDY